MSVKPSSKPPTTLLANNEYYTKPPNDPRMGFNYEDENVIHAFLTLNDGQELAREVLLDKVDDLVIRVNNEKNAETFYIRQFKHKQDIASGKAKTLAWDDLLGKKTSGFNLLEYLLAFLKVDLKNISMNSSGHDTIEEISLNTNIGFESCTGESNLKDFLKNKQNKTDCNAITEGDLSDCFEEKLEASVWNSSFLGHGKKYKFSSHGAGEIAGILRQSSHQIPIPNQPNTAVQQQDFLDRLVFEVDQLGIKELDNVNQSVMKIYAPFYSNYYGTIKEEILALFKPTRSVEDQSKPAGKKHIANWVKTSDREAIFKNLILKFKEQNDLGSIPGYEANQLAPLFEQTSRFSSLLKLDAEKLRCSSPWYPDLESFLESNSSDESNNVLKIFSKDSKAMLTLLKAYKLLKDSALLHQSLIVQINKKADAEDLIEYFQELDKELQPYKMLHRKHFCLIVETSSAEPEIVRLLNDAFSVLTDLRKWIQFVVIWEALIQGVEYDAEDEPLKWEDLPENVKTHLFTKPLSINDKFQTTLEKLGFDIFEAEKWIKHRALAELILYETNIPLPLPLPNYDHEIDTMYIERKVKLPSIDKARTDQELLERIAFSEQDDDAFVWSRSNDNSVDFDQMKRFVIPSKSSKFECDEDHLLSDDQCFGSGSDNRLAIIVDYPGKGKSTLLASLSNNYLKKHRSETVTRHEILFNINLVDCYFGMKAIKSAKEAFDFLLDFLLNRDENHFEGKRLAYQQLVNPILQQLFLNSSGLPSVLLMLDSFDEITQNEREVTCQLVEQLLEYAPGIKRIILTSRPDEELDKFLEGRFRRFVLHLKDFSTRDQINFLFTQWSRRLVSLGDHDECDQDIMTDKIWDFTMDFVLKAQEMLTDKDKCFLGVPLQCYIFSECFLPDLKSYLENDKTMNELDNVSFNLIRLYKRFFESKIYIFLQEKAKMHFCGNSNETAIAIIIHNIQTSFGSALKRLAVFHMMSDVQEAELLYRISWQVYKEQQYLEDVQMATKLGFLKKIENSSRNRNKLERPDVKFIHRTFAEYFFARYVYDIFNQRHSELLDGDMLSDEQRLQVCRAMFTSLNYTGIRTFFNQMLFSSDFVDEAYCSERPNVEDEIVQQSPPIFSHTKFNRLLARTLLEAVSPNAPSSARVKDSLLESLFDFSKDDQTRLWLLECLKENVAKAPNNIISYCVTAAVWLRYLTHENFEDKFFNVFHESFCLSQNNECFENGGQRNSAEEPWQLVKRLLKFMSLKKHDCLLVITKNNLQTPVKIIEALIVLSITVELETTARKTGQTDKTCKQKYSAWDVNLLQLLSLHGRYIFAIASLPSLNLKTLPIPSEINISSGQSILESLLIKSNDIPVIEMMLKCYIVSSQNPSFFEHKFFINGFISSMFKMACYYNWFAHPFFTSDSMQLQSSEEIKKNQIALSLIQQFLVELKRRTSS